MAPDRVLKILSDLAFAAFQDRLRAHEHLPLRLFAPATEMQGVGQMMGLPEVLSQPLLHVFGAAYVERRRPVGAIILPWGGEGSGGPVWKLLQQLVCSCGIFQPDDIQGRLFFGIRPRLVRLPGVNEKLAPAGMVMGGAKSSLSPYLSETYLMNSMKRT